MVEYKNAEKYLHILENLREKLFHIRNTCGSGFIHDARENYRGVDYIVEDISRYLSQGEKIESMFDYEIEPLKQIPYSKMTEAAFEIRANNIIKKAEEFLVMYAKK